MRRILLWILCCCCLCGVALSDTAPPLSDAAFYSLPNAVAYRFSHGDTGLVLDVSTAFETGQHIIWAAEGIFSGEIALPLTPSGCTVTVRVQTLSGKEIKKITAKTADPLPGPLPPINPDGLLSGVTVCIDPGHQAGYIVGKEPLGPGLSGEKDNVIGAAMGVVTRRREPVVVLEIGFLLRDALIREGASVVMTRESQDVLVSNTQRAAIANEANADFMLRLHGNNRDNASVQGIQIYVPKNSAYAKAVAPSEVYLGWGQTLLAAMKTATGQTKGDAFASDNYVGSNWAKMPCFLIEMGYMSNAQEDRLLSDRVYQQKLVDGMVQGLINLSGKPQPMEDFPIPAVSVDAPKTSLTAEHLIQSVTEKLGKGYLFGASGQTVTARMVRSRAAENPDNAEAMLAYGMQWVDVEAYDCLGLVKAFLKEAGAESISTGGINVTRAWSQWTGATGTLEGALLQPGMLLFRAEGSRRVWTHVGVYIGNGRIIQAKGTRWGVLETDAPDVFTHWATLHFVDYANSPLESQCYTDTPFLPIGSQAVIMTDTGKAAPVASTPYEQGKLKRNPIGTFADGTEVTVLEVVDEMSRKVEGKGVGGKPLIGYVRLTDLVKP